MTFCKKVMIAILPKILIDYDCYGVCKIERSGLGAHGDAEGGGIVIFQKRFGESASFFAEEDEAVFFKLDIRMNYPAFGAGKKRLNAGGSVSYFNRFVHIFFSDVIEVFEQKFLKIFISSHLGYIPIVESAAL